MDNIQISTLEIVYNRRKRFQSRVFVSASLPGEKIPLTDQ